jgi:hypothetical protein
MRCSAFRTENPADSSFCEACGAALEIVCASCGAAARPNTKFCRKCGAALHGLGAGNREAGSPAPVSYTPRHLADKILQSKAALEGERKQVTVLFADLQGSMRVDRRPRPRGGAQAPRPGPRTHDALISASLTLMRNIAVELLDYGSFYSFTRNVMTSNEIRQFLSSEPMR